MVKSALYHFSIVITPGFFFSQKVSNFTEWWDGVLQKRLTCLGFVCFVVIDRRVLSTNRLICFFLLHNFFQFYPPPPIILISQPRLLRTTQSMPLICALLWATFLLLWILEGGGGGEDKEIRCDMVLPIIFVLWLSFCFSFPHTRSVFLLDPPRWHSFVEQPKSQHFGTHTLTGTACRYGGEVVGRLLSLYGSCNSGFCFVS